MPSPVRRVSSLGAVLDPCVLARVTLTLLPNTPVTVRFAVTTASTPQASSAAAKRILSVTEPSLYSRVDETARRLKLSGEQVESAMALLPLILYHSPDKRIPDALLPALAKGQRSLWSLGISGDLPIVTAAVEDDDDVEASSELVSAHRLLYDNGAAFDLVFLIRSGGEYRSKLRDGLLDVLRRHDAEASMAARGGIHLCDASSDAAGIVRAVAVAVAEAGAAVRPPARDEELKPLPRQFFSRMRQEPLSYGYNEDNSFTFTVDGRLPNTAWSHVLANASYGFLASDAGTGHMWHMNARENKINRWLNDSLTTDGTERLKIVRNGAETSLFAENDGCRCRVTYGFGWAEWKKTISGVTFTTTAFVPPSIPARVLIIESDNGDGRAESDSLLISYFTDLVLYPNVEESVFVTTSREDGVISAQNVYNSDFPETVFRVASLLGAGIVHLLENQRVKRPI